MKFARSAVMLLALAATVAACEEDPTDNDDIVVADLAGSYSVQSFEYEADDESNSFDLATVPTASGGPLGITEMTVETDGSFEGVLKLPQGNTIATLDIGGTISLLSQSEMRIDFDATTDAYGVLDDFEDGSFTLSGNTLTLVLPDVTFDFTQSGAEPVESDLTIVATRS